MSVNLVGTSRQNEEGASLELCIELQTPWKEKLRAPTDRRKPEIFFGAGRD
jgi:hypothetical protein